MTEKYSNHWIREHERLKEVNKELLRALKSVLGRLDKSLSIEEIEEAIKLAEQKP